ncbi:MAG: HAMP domain-containing protein [Frankiales bacterium]|nr:HAMP domain-containing protein [Frankiales bacterium]
MRRRLLLLVFSTTLLALTILGVVLMTVIWAAMSSAKDEHAHDTASFVASYLQDSIVANDGAAHITESTLIRVPRNDAWLQAVLPDGRVVQTGPVPDGGGFTGTGTAGSGPTRVTVTAVIPRSLLVGEVVQEGLIVVALSLLALGVAMVIASVYARRLTRPLEDFAESAELLSTGDRRAVGRRYGIEELDAVADELDRAVTSFNDVLERERRVTAEASHQLRSPLTALSLRLEEILAADDLDVVHAEATAALGQVERLSGVVDDVVSVGRGFPLEAASRYPIDDLVRGQVVEWTPAFEAQGRELEALGSVGLWITGARGAQAQVLATLIENSLVHGGGRTMVRVRASGTWVVIEVGDQGAGVAPEVERRVFERSVSGGGGSGLGLALARTLVAADGGRLEMISARPAVFAMFLPTRRSRASDQPGPETSGEPALPAPAEPSAQAQDGAAAAVAEPGQTEVEMAASSAAAGSAGNTQRR